MRTSASCALPGVIAVKSDGDLRWERVGPLGGEHRRGRLVVTGVERVVDALDLRGHIGDHEGPFVDVPVDGLGAEPDLRDRCGSAPSRRDRSGSPLNPDRAALQLLGPGTTVGVQVRVVMAQTGPGQCPLESTAGDLDGDCPFLPGFGRLAAAIHHPQERRLDPGHPVSLERRHEPASRHRRLGDLRRVSLVHGPTITDRQAQVHRISRPAARRTDLLDVRVILIDFSVLTCPADRSYGLSRRVSASPHGTRG